MKRFVTIALTLHLVSALPAGADTLMIRGATLHTMSEAGIVENADILVSGEAVHEIGRDLPVPADIRVYEANGRPVTPGLFAGVSAIGIGEVSGVPESMDAVNAMPEMRPEFDVSVAFNPNSSLVPVTRIEGYTFSLLGADQGTGIVHGQGRIAALDGGYSSLHGEPVLFVTIGRVGPEISGGSRAAQWMQLEQAMLEAINPPMAGVPSLLTLSGRHTVVEFMETGTVVFKVNRASDILQAIRFADRYGFDAAIAGGAEAWMVADELAAAGVAVLLNPLQNLPSNFDALGSRLDNAALLDGAGVKIAFTGAGSHNARKQRQLAGNAVANGLRHEAALAALTIAPAEIFGVADLFGSLEEGKRADLVLWSGDPLEVTTVAELVIINGRIDPMRSRQTELLERYLVEDPEMPRAYLK